MQPTALEPCVALHSQKDKKDTEEEEENPFNKTTQEAEDPGGYQHIHSLHFCQGLEVPVGMVQVEGHTVHPLELRPRRQLELGVAPLQQLVVVLYSPLVMPLDEGHLEGAFSLVDDWQVLPVVLHNLHTSHRFCILLTPLSSS